VKTDILSELKVSTTFNFQICYCDVWKFFLDSCMMPVWEDLLFCLVGCKQSFALGHCDHLSDKRCRCQSVCIAACCAVITSPLWCAQWWLYLTLTAFTDLLHSLQVCWNKLSESDLSWNWLWRQRH
jgi:hypothetical protein